MITKESEAWTHLAEVFSQFGHDADGGETFLCWAIKPDEYLEEESPRSLASRVAADTREVMCSRIKLDLGESTAWGGAYDDDKEMSNPEKTEARVLACLMFAHEAKSEGR